MSDKPQTAKYQKIHESQYGGDPLNFHITKCGDELHVELTYPPWTDADNKNGQCRYIFVDQEATRASDGVRLHYDYKRDGFVVEQPRPRLVARGNNSYEDVIDWIEVGFFPSWRFNKRDGDVPSKEEFERADKERNGNV